jgi:hypothetical protein
MYIKDHPWDRCSLIESLSNCLPLIIFFFAVLSVASFHLLFLLFLFSSRFHPCIDTHVNPNYFGTLSSVVKQLQRLGVILVLQLSLCRTMDSGASTDLKHYFSPPFLQLWSNSRNFGVILVLQFSLCRTMDSGVSTDLKLRSRKSNSSMNIFWVWQHCRLTQNEFLRIYIYAAANC